jgi:DNA-binding transcriptional ArsR family regulator
VTKLVLLVLADYYDDERKYAWPSQERLAQDCEMPLRTVKYALKELTDMGLVTRIQKGNQHQPSHWGLALDVPSQGYEGTEGGSTLVAPSDVKVHRAASESTKIVSVSSTSLQEPTVKKDPSPPNPTLEHEWLDILSQDPRWPKKPDPAFTERIEREHAGVPLTTEAMRCYAWLQDTPKGRKRTSLHMVWLNWLKNHADDHKNGRLPHGSGNRQSQGTPPTPSNAFDKYD